MIRLGVARQYARLHRLTRTVKTIEPATRRRFLPRMRSGRGSRAGVPFGAGIAAAAAALVFLVALLAHYRMLLAAGIADFALVPDTDGAMARFGLAHSDLRYVVWVVARNAHTWLHAPTRIFEALPCFPSENALALGEPALTLGLLGTPVMMLLGEPVASFNFALLVSVFVAAMAMYWLVWDWTRRPLAGVIAGLAYGYHTIKLWDSLHPYVWDNGWTLLALLFAVRFARHGRWRDALALSLACVLQLGGSFYALAGAMLVALPMCAWLLAHHGVHALRAAPCAFVVVALGLGAYGAFGPALELSGSGALPAREVQIFARWGAVMPGGSHFAGWSILGLAWLGVVVRDPRRVRNVRWAVLAACLLVTYTAAGGNAGDRLEAELRGAPPPAALPNPYALLAAWLPGFDVVRVPAVIYSGAHLALGVLVGLGAAGLLRRLPARASTPVGVALALVVWMDAARPAFLGFEPRARYQTEQVRPPVGEIAFFDAMAAAGSTGPLFELPLTIHRDARSVLMTLHHGRRTSACYGSYRPHHEAFERIAGALPAADAVRELAALGFTTVVVHHPRVFVRRPLAERLAQQQDPALRKLLATPERTAYRIEIRSVHPVGTGW
jgi:hypothetical protein